MFHNKKPCGLNADSAQVYCDLNVSCMAESV